MYKYSLLATCLVVVLCASSCQGLLARFANGAFDSDSNSLDAAVTLCLYSPATNFNYDNSPSRSYTAPYGTGSDFIELFNYGTWTARLVNGTQCGSSAAGSVDLLSGVSQKFYLYQDHVYTFLATTSQSGKIDLVLFDETSQKTFDMAIFEAYAMNAYMAIDLNGGSVTVDETMENLSNDATLTSFEESVWNTFQSSSNGVAYSFSCTFSNVGNDSLTVSTTGTSTIGFMYSAFYVGSLTDEVHPPSVFVLSSNLTDYQNPPDYSWIWWTLLSVVLLLLLCGAAAAIVMFGAYIYRSKLAKSSLYEKL